MSLKAIFINVDQCGMPLSFLETSLFFCRGVYKNIFIRFLEALIVMTLNLREVLTQDLRVILL